LDTDHSYFFQSKAKYLKTKLLFSLSQKDYALVIHELIEAINLIIELDSL